nr:immunoglobulin heavy chain junction region [Macaca mulatta]MOX63842.1 immunoglobulin heavy chain junction region [Macaca mulatta]MOX65255.1 immunoglobulin heavy chain junction region [Macaca mulatta]
CATGGLRTPHYW